MFLSPFISADTQTFPVSWWQWRARPPAPLEVPKSDHNISVAYSQSHYFSLPSFSCLWMLYATKSFTIWIYFRILSVFINKWTECSFYMAVIQPHCCSRAYYLIYIFKCFSKCRISGLESKTFHFFVLRPTQSTSKVRYGVDIQQQTCLHGIWKPVELKNTVSITVMQVSSAKPRDGD